MITILQNLNCNITLELYSSIPKLSIQTFMTNYKNITYKIITSKLIAWKPNKNIQLGFLYNWKMLHSTLCSWWGFSPGMSPLALSPSCVEPRLQDSQLCTTGVLLFSWVPSSSSTPPSSMAPPWLCAPCRRLGASPWSPEGHAGIVLGTMMSRLQRSS